jgi:hypothetical protein
MAQHKVNKELYFGASMVYFRECEGEAASFSTDAFEVRKTFTEQEKLRFLPQEHLGDEYKEFVGTLITQVILLNLKLFLYSVANS